MDFSSCAWGIVQKHSLEEGCAGVMLSKILGYAVVAGSAFLKFPQIFNILASKSAEGLSRESTEAETIGYGIALGYSMYRGMAFNAYGECLFLLLQDLVVMLLLTAYGDKKFLRLALFFALFPLGFGGLQADLIPENLMEAFYGGMQLIFIYARAQQFWVNLKAKSTGQLSVVTCGMNTVGTCVRVLTTWQENGGLNMMVSYLVSLVLNSALLAQIFVYKPKQKKSE